MFWASDTSRLLHAGSSGVNYIGGARTVSIGSTPAVLNTHHFVEEFGDITLTGIGASSVVTIPNSGYSGRPWIFLGQCESIGSTPGTVSLAGTMGAFGVSKTTFTIMISGVGGSTETIVWRSVGSRVL
jgi:hypothetical protein